MHPMLNTAVKAARRAGSIINRASFDTDKLTVRDKSIHDYVSEVDEAAERAIIETLLSAYPDHAILAEESGERGDAEYQWVIDPLDGTTNFLHGLPQYAVSIALVHRGTITHGLVYDPARNDLYTASRGSGAFLNNRRIRVSRRERFAEALIGTGFPFRDFQHLDLYLELLKELMPKCAGLRRPGSAALDLAFTACGYYDAFFEINLAPWDIAAGILLVQEAGGIATDFAGGGNSLASGNIIAGSPKIFAQLLRILEGKLPDELKN